MQASDLSSNNFSLPTYNLQFFLPENISTGTIDDIQIADEMLTPRNTSYPSDFLEVIKGIAQLYIFDSGKNFESVDVKVDFSLDRGFTFTQASDPRFQQIFKKHLKELGGKCIPSQKAKEDNICHLKQAELDENYVNEVELEDNANEVKANPDKGNDLKANSDTERLNQKTSYLFDPLVYQLWKRGIRKPLHLHLKVSKISKTHFKAWATGFFKYPHLLENLAKEFAGKENLKICLVGTRVLEQPNLPPTCPQFLELFSLFPSGRFLLLNSSLQEVNTLERQVKDIKVAFYDPMMIAFYNTEGGKNHFQQYLKVYQNIFDQMKKNLILHAKNRQHAKWIFNATVKPEMVPICVDPEKIHIELFDILSSNFPKELQKSFDIIMATDSIFLAIDQSREKSKERINDFPILAKFLQLLKEGGTLYIDADLMDQCFYKYYDRKAVDLGITWLEASLGNKLNFKTVPVDKCIEYTAKDDKLVVSFNLTHLKTPSVTKFVVTKPIIAITRTGEKVDSNKKRCSRLSKRLDELIAKPKDINEKKQFSDSKIAQTSIVNEVELENNDENKKNDKSKEKESENSQ